MAFAFSARSGAFEINQPRKNILITGATGFVGQALCRSVASGDANTKDWHVRALLRGSSNSEVLPPEIQATSVVADLFDSDSLLPACAGVDTILHLAGEAHVGNIQHKHAAHSAEAVAEKLIAAALQQGVRRIVFVSSSLAHSAESNSGDVTAYGKSKLAAEALFNEACGSGKLEAVILRPVNVYGVGMKGNIAGMISMIEGGRLPPLPKIPSRISLLGVQDLVLAIILAANSQKANGETYTITDGAVYALNDIEAAIYESLGKTMPSWCIPAVILYAASAAAGLLNKTGIRPSSISTRTYRNLMSDNLFDNESVCQDLGFEPSITLYEALPEIVEDIVSKGRKA